MINLKATAKTIQSRVDAFTYRERIIIGIAFLAAVYLLWDAIIIGNTFEADKQRSIQAESMKTNIESIDQKVKALEQMIVQNSVSGLNAKIEVLRKQNAILHERIVKEAGALVGPKEMVKVLKELVEKIEGLTVIRVENVSTKPLFQTQKPAVPNQNSPEPQVSNLRPVQVYIHTVEMDLEGDYSRTLTFLESVEKDKLQIWWDEIEYTVTVYPRAKVKITLHTLSLDEGFIGA